MASFRFNFGKGEKDTDDATSGSRENCLEPQMAKEVLTPKHLNQDMDNVDKAAIDGATLLHVKVGYVEEILKKSSILYDSVSNSDLVPAVYEGGLKIWECTIDLVEYLHELAINFQDKRVLELGCGAGLPGIYALKNGAIVDFQDYNHEVLEHFTIPSVFANIRASYPQSTDVEVRDLLGKKCRFFAGDWKFVTSFINPEMKPEELYDIILTSETIYNVDNYSKLIYLFEKHLKYPDGVVYVAAKTHYFGVGGGTRSFEELVKKSKYFEITVCKKFQGESQGGLQREILKMKWNK